MAEFSQGLLAGFQFVDNLRARAQSQQLQKERIGLARAADARAEATFQQQSQDRERRILRERRSDRASQLLARAQSEGYENLQPHEQAELQESAAYNPNIAPFLEEARLQRQDVEAITGLRGVTQRTGRQPQSQATSQPSAQQPSSNQVTQPPSGEVPSDAVTPFQVAAPDEEGLPPAETGGTIRRPRVYVERLLGAELPEEVTTRDKRIVELPREFINELEAARDLPAVQQQQAMNRLRERVTGLPQEVDFARTAQAVARENVSQWQSFIDPQDEDGAALRQAAAERPSFVTEKLHREWNTLAEKNPNALVAVAREMKPVVQQTLEESMATLQEAPVENGRVDMSDPQLQEAQRNFNNALELQEQMSDSWSGEYEARIRNNAMPVGNAQLSSELRGILDETPPPGLPAGEGQRRANATIANRAVNAVAAGNTRTLTTRQVQSLAWLAKRGYITPNGFEQFLATGTFSDPADAEFVDHDPDKILWRVGPNGEREVVWMPPKLSGVTDAKAQFDAGQLEFMSDNVFVDPSGTDEGEAFMRQTQNEFLITLHQNPEALGLRGWDSEDVSKLTPQQVALLGERFKALKHAESTYEKSFWARWMPFTADKFEELVDEDGEPLGYANFDEWAREHEIDVPPLPEPQADTRAARLWLATNEDPYYRYLSIILDEQELSNAVLEAKAAETNP